MFVKKFLPFAVEQSIARAGFDEHAETPPFFDQLFNPSRPLQVSFGRLAKQYLQLTEEDGANNRLGRKGLDRQRATVALIREM